MYLYIYIHIYVYICIYISYVILYHIILYILKPSNTRQIYYGWTKGMLAFLERMGEKGARLKLSIDTMLLVTATNKTFSRKPVLLTGDFCITQLKAGGPS
jgi:hypothetical protein